MAAFTWNLWQQKPHRQ